MTEVSFESKLERTPIPEASIAAVRGFADDVCRGGALGVLVVGSVPAGLATPRSDLDLLIVSTTGLPIAARNMRLLGQMRVDVESVTVATIEGAIQRVARFDTGRDHLYGVHDEYKLVALLCSPTWIVRDATGAVAALLDLARSDAGALARVGTSRSAVWGNNTLDDVAGFVADSDLESATRRSLHALELAVDAWCVAHGELYPDEKFKWLWRRLRRVPAPMGSTDLADCYLSELAGCEERGWDLVSRRVELAQGLLARSLLVAWDQHVVEEQPADIPGEPATAWPLRRSTAWHAQRLEDGWRIARDGESYDVPVTAAIAWAYAERRSVDDLVERVRTAPGGGRQLPVDVATSVVDRLTSLGVLLEAPRTGEQRAGSAASHLSARRHASEGR